MGVPDPLFVVDGLKDAADAAGSSYSLRCVWPADDFDYNQMPLIFVLLFRRFSPRFLTYYNRCLEAVGMPTLQYTTTRFRALSLQKSREQIVIPDFP